MKTALKQHFKPTPIIFAEYFRFHWQNQTVRKSVSQYLVERRWFASTCEFGVFLDEASWDRFICALYKENIHKRLGKKKRSHVTADTAISIEIAKNDVANIKTFTPVVNKIQQSFSVQQPAAYIATNYCVRWLTCCLRKEFVICIQVKLE